MASSLLYSPCPPRPHLPHFPRPHNALFWFPRVEGDYGKALEYYKWARDIRQAQEHPRHHPMADCLYNMALIHKHLRQYSASQEAFTQAAQHFTLALGADHEETRDCLVQADRARVLASKELPTPPQEAETAI